MRASEFKLTRTSDGRLKLIPKWVLSDDYPRRRRKVATRRGVRLEEFALYSPPRPARERFSLVRAITPDGREVIKVVRIKSPEKPAGFLWGTY